MIGGTIHINEYNYVEWEATNEGPYSSQSGGVCIYNVTLDMRDDRGYPRHITFDVTHLPADGMLVLTSIILLEANRRING